jgi:hypothetical protein
VTELGSYAASEFDFALVLALRAVTGPAKPDAVHRCIFNQTEQRGTKVITLLGFSGEQGLLSNGCSTQEKRCDRRLEEIVSYS